MEKGKLKDFLSASKDEFVAAVINSENLPAVIETVADVVVSEGTASIVGELVGAASPRLNGIRLSYKQNRFERRVETALATMNRRIDVLEQNYAALSDEMKEKFCGEYLGWLMDNLQNEKQQEKVQYHVNGYINLMTNDANDNLILLFFNTLNELTQLDIDVLRMYSIDAQENIYGVCERYGLKPEQTAAIKEKLARLGLLQSRNDTMRDKNIDLIVDYLKAVAADAKKKSPKGVKLPSIKKPSRSESYSITSLGNGYLAAISE